MQIELSAKQFSRLANIMDNAGQIVMGTIVLNPIIIGAKNIDYVIIFSGILTTISLWIISLILEK